MRKSRRQDFFYILAGRLRAPRGSSGGQCAPAPRGLSTSDVRVVVEPHKAHQKKAGDEARKIPSSENTENNPTSSESKNGKARLNLKGTVGAPGHSNLVLHQQKCCCVISKGRAFQPPTSHLPTAMGSSRTRKTVGFKSNSNSKPLHPLIQNQSTPRRDQVHGCAQLSSVLLLVWLVWHESSPKKLPWEPNRDMPDRPDLPTTRVSYLRRSPLVAQIWVS